MKTYLTVLLLLAVCTVLPACAGLQVGGNTGSASAVAMSRHTLVRQSLDQLIAAYEAKSAGRFAELVSERYTGEESILDTAVRQDFSRFHDLSLRYTVNNITLDDGGKASVAITFTRGWTEIKTSRTRSETGETSLVFVLEQGVYKLYSQSRPPLFGLD